jgi:hypothetical protein
MHVVLVMKDNEITAELRIGFVMAAYLTSGHEASLFRASSASVGVPYILISSCIGLAGIAGNKGSYPSARQWKQMLVALSTAACHMESVVAFLCLLCSFFPSSHSLILTLPGASGHDATGKVRPAPLNWTLDVAFCLMRREWPFRIHQKIRDGLHRSLSLAHGYTTLPYLYPYGLSVWVLSR